MSRSQRPACTLLVQCFGSHTRIVSSAGDIRSFPGRPEEIDSERRWSAVWYPHDGQEDFDCFYSAAGLMQYAQHIFTFAEKCGGILVQGSWIRNPDKAMEFARYLLRRAEEAEAMKTQEDLREELYAALGFNSDPFRDE